jgi:hypothetical protein
LLEGVYTLCIGGGGAMLPSGIGSWNCGKRRESESGQRIARCGVCAVGVGDSDGGGAHDEQGQHAPAAGVNPGYPACRFGVAGRPRVGVILLFMTNIL